MRKLVGYTIQTILVLGLYTGVSLDVGFFWASAIIVFSIVITGLLAWSIDLTSSKR